MCIPNLRQLQLISKLYWAHYFLKPFFQEAAMFVCIVMDFYKMGELPDLNYFVTDKPFACHIFKNLIL